MNFGINRGFGLTMLLVLCMVAALFTAGCIDLNRDTSTSIVSTPGIAAPDDYVEVDYTGTLSDGEVFDSSIDRGEPLGFVIASGAMIPGFDEAVRGMAVGETKTVTIPNEEAYGDWTEEMIISVPRDLSTEEEEPPVVGEIIYLSSGMGFFPVTVLEVTDEVIIVDGNHQLAGEDLTFEITMLKVVKPDDPEHPSNAASIDDPFAQEFVIETPEEPTFTSTVTTPVPVSIVSTPGIAAPNDYVEVDYTGTLSDGEVFDSSIGFQPLGFVIASGAMIPGFDDAVRGMAVGETKTVTIPSEDAYGAWTEDMIISIPRDLLTEEEEEPPVVGEDIYLFSGMGFVPATVIEVTDEEMVVDANHQLAGKDLTFEITMVKIVKPDDPEHPSNAASTESPFTQEFVIEVPEISE